MKVPPPPMDQAAEMALARSVAALAPLVGAEASIKHLWGSRAVLFEREGARALVHVTKRRPAGGDGDRARDLESIVGDTGATVAGTWVRGQGPWNRAETLRALGDVLAVPREESEAAVNALAASDGAAVARRRRAQATVDAHAEDFARDAVAALARGINERPPAIPRGVRWERDVESRMPALIAADDAFDWSCVPEQLRADPDGGVLLARLDRAAADAFASAGTDAAPEELHHAAHDALDSAPLIARLRQSEVARRAARGGGRITTARANEAEWAMLGVGRVFTYGRETVGGCDDVDKAAGERGAWVTEMAGQSPLHAVAMLAARGVALGSREAFAAIVLAAQPPGEMPRGALLADESAWSIVAEAQRLLGGTLRAHDKLAWHATTGPAALEPFRGVTETLEAAQRGCGLGGMDPEVLARWGRPDGARQRRNVGGDRGRGPHKRRDAACASHVAGVATNGD